MQTQASAKGADKSGLAVFLCFLVAMLEGYDIQAFGVAAKRLIADFGLTSATQQSLVSSGAMIGLTIGAVIGGVLADRFGRKPVLIVSTVVFGLGSVFTAFAFDYHSLLAMRLLTGLGFGGALPNLIAIATEVAKPGKRAATVTMVFCGMPAGGAIVSLMAPMVLQSFSWHAIFILGGVAPLIVALALFTLPETRPTATGAPKANLLKVLFGEGRALSSLMLWLTFFMTLVVLYLMLNWLPTLVIDKGYTEAEGQAAAFWFNIMSVAGALITGFIADRFGFRWPLLVMYLSVAVVLFFLAKTTSLTSVLVLTGLAGFTVLGANYAMYAAAPAYYPPSARAAGAGAAVAVGRLGSIIGPVIAPQLRGAGFSADQVFLFLIPVALIAGGAAFLLTIVCRPDADNS
jgi:MFS transporter, AAHS family, 3-hydroxyphenylpropionic acid transporter